MDRKFALLVGNGQYDYFRALEKSAADVQALADALRSPNIGAFDEILTLIDQPVQKVRRAIEQFFQEKNSTDLLLLYLSGHGELDRRDQWYFVCKETESVYLSATAISAHFFKEVMDKSHSVRQIVILDTCYAGAFLTGAKGEADPTQSARTQLAGSGRAILAATSRTERAWEGDQQTPTSVFTHYLVQGLITGAADTKNRGVITVDDWFDYTAGQMINAKTQQTPRKQIENLQGSLIVARNPYWGALQEGSAITAGQHLSGAFPENGDRVRESIWQEAGEQTSKSEAEQLHQGPINRIIGGIRMAACWTVLIPYWLLMGYTTPKIFPQKILRISGSTYLVMLFVGNNGIIQLLKVLIILLSLVIDWFLVGTLLSGIPNISFFALPYTIVSIVVGLSLLFILLCLAVGFFYLNVKDPPWPYVNVVNFRKILEVTLVTALLTLASQLQAFGAAFLYFPIAASIVSLCLFFYGVFRLGDTSYADKVLKKRKDEQERLERESEAYFREIKK